MMKKRNIYQKVMKIVLLSDSNKATLKIVGEVKDDSGTETITKIIWSVFQVILLIIIILLALAFS